MNSAKLWTTVSKGGEGYFDKLGDHDKSNFKHRTIISSDTSKPKTDQKVGVILIADALGAFSGFLQGALPYFLSGGPVNPVSNGILIGRAIITGVTGSVTTAAISAVK